jgi:hypothetical protein
MECLEQASALNFPSEQVAIEAMEMIEADIAGQRPADDGADDGEPKFMDTQVMMLRTTPIPLSTVMGYCSTNISKPMGTQELGSDASPRFVDDSGDDGGDSGGDGGGSGDEGDEEDMYEEIDEFQVGAGPVMTRSYHGSYQLIAWP